MTARGSIVGPRVAGIAGILLGLAPVPAARADHAPIVAEWSAPHLDRWMYPFNPTPGTRPTASTFGSEAGSTMFDSRDGQMILGWDTSAQVEAGLAPGEYTIHEAEVIVQVANDVATYDPSIDPWTCFVAQSDPAYTPDSDPGQPIELFGLGFRNGFTAQSFLENSPYAAAGADPLAPGVRNAFAFGSTPAGGMGDVSNAPRAGFTATPFAVGTASVSPGAILPKYTDVRFALSVTDPSVAGYLQQGLSDGRLRFTVTSLTQVVQGGGPFPAFFTKENVEVGFGLAHAASLRVVVTVGSDCIPEDLDCDGAVSGGDLAALLSQWGSAGPADFDQSGAVGGGDLAQLLSAWAP